MPLQIPAQNSPAEAADPRCCPGTWRKRQMPGRSERYKDGFPPTGAPSTSCSRTATRRMASLLQPSYYHPESRPKRPLDGSQAPGPCSAQDQRQGRPPCLTGYGT